MKSAHHAYRFLYNLSNMQVSYPHTDLVSSTFTVDI